MIYLFFCFCFPSFLIHAITTPHEADFYTYGEITLFPVQFGIPDEWVKDEVPEKTQVVVNDTMSFQVKSYRFGPLEEAEYHDYLAASMFGDTRKKGGWDCLRHYELMANGCLPIFWKLEEWPATLLRHLPWELLTEAKRFYNKFLEKFEEAPNNKSTEAENNKQVKGAATRNVNARTRKLEMDLEEQIKCGGDHQHVNDVERDHDRLAYQNTKHYLSHEKAMNQQDISKEDLEEHRILGQKFLDYTKENLTTAALAKRILKNYGIDLASPSSKKPRILFLPGHALDLFPSFLCASVFHGLRELLGENVVDAPEYTYMYKLDGETADTVNRIRGSVWGQGFTLGFRLDRMPFLDRDNIEQRIKDQEFDFIIYGRLSPYELSTYGGTVGGKAALVPEYFETVLQYTDPERIIMLYGDDSGLDDYHVRSQLNTLGKRFGGYVYLRELLPFIPAENEQPLIPRIKLIQQPQCFKKPWATFFDHVWVSKEARYCVNYGYECDKTFFYKTEIKDNEEYAEWYEKSSRGYSILDPFKMMDEIPTPIATGTHMFYEKDARNCTADAVFEQGRECPISNLKFGVLRENVKYFLLELVPSVDLLNSQYCSSGFVIKSALFAALLDAVYNMECVGYCQRSCELSHARMLKPLLYAPPKRIKQFYEAFGTTPMYLAQILSGACLRYGLDLQSRVGGYGRGRQEGDDDLEKREFPEGFVPGLNVMYHDHLKTYLLVGNNGVGADVRYMANQGFTFHLFLLEDDSIFNGFEAFNIENLQIFGPWQMGSVGFRDQFVEQSFDLQQHVSSHAHFHFGKVYEILIAFASIYYLRILDVPKSDLWQVIAHASMKYDFYKLTPAHSRRISRPGMEDTLDFERGINWRSIRPYSFPDDDTLIFETYDVFLKWN